MFRQSVSLAAIAASLLWASSVRAQTAAEAEAASPLEELVVSASRSGQAIRSDLLGASVTVISPQALELRQTRVISDVLRDIPGISVSRTGTVGGLTQVRVRGAEGNHVLMLIDGMEVSDPGQGEFDFATLIADDVARIEVLRGQQSALYGSDAIAGVIHYMTASGAEAPGVRGRVEVGSFKTAGGAVRAAGVTGPLDVAVSAAYQTTDGVPTSRFGVRDLDAKNHALAGKATLTLAPNVRVRAVLRNSYTNADTNPSDYNWPPGPSYGFTVDGTNYFVNKALYGLVRGEAELLEGRWSHHLTLQGVNSRRTSYNGPGAPSSASKAERRKVSYDTSLRFGDDALGHVVTLGVDQKRESYRNLPLTPVVTPQNAQRHIDNTGLVAQYELEAGGRVGFGAAVRQDRNDRFKDVATYRLQGSYRFDGGFRVRAATGSGIKNPTMTELFGFNPTTYRGNPNLKAEQSRGWEIGAEQTLLDNQLKIGVTYFDSKLKDEIYFVSLGGGLSTYGNRGTDSTQKGVETIVQARLGRQWTVDGAYTYLKARENGVEEIRRPPHIASLNVTWTDLQDRFGGNLTVRYNGETNDNFFGATTQTIRMPAFTLVNLGGHWNVTRGLQVFGRVENAFDQDYEEVFGYKTQGRAAYIGLRAGF